MLFFFLINTKKENTERRNAKEQHSERRERRDAASFYLTLLYGMTTSWVRLLCLTKIFKIFSPLAFK